MELNWDSPHWNKVHSRSGKFLIFATLEKIKPRGQNILTASSYHASYGFSLKWEALVKQIQNIIIAVFEGYFHRNNWFQQSISIVNDVACILDLNNLLWQEMIKEVDDAIIDSSLHAKADGRTITIDDIPRSVTAVVEGLLQRNHKWIHMELNSQWRVESRRRSPRLPLELWKLVIDNLHGFCKRETLVNCCLTCHEFLHWSRNRLYAQVKFTTHSRAIIQSFFRSLSQYPYLRPLVAEVKFIDNKTCTKTFTEFFLHGPPLLPNLQSVTIGYMNSPLHPSLTLVCNRHPFYSATRLELYSCTFGSVLDFRRLIDSFFPYATHLIMTTVRMCSSHVLLPPKLAQKKRLSLSKLQVTYDVPPGVCQWLSSSQTPDSLKSLYIQASDLPKMLPSLGRHLQLLRVYWNMYEDKLDESLSFGADVLPVLQTLVIDTLSQSTQVRTFCRVFSRSGLASSLRYIQIRDVVKVSLVLLDDTLAKLDDHVQIAVERARWEFLPKLKSKGVLAIPADIVW
ncbi:hypothetical protein C8Q75DRAFT_185533 [Abortiporus biennis]|nr:hypothetical protein C8Q75DRAFT_185533 [Abortiporus biennis]